MEMRSEVFMGGGLGWDRGSGSGALSRERAAPKVLKSVGVAADTGGDAMNSISSIALSGLSAAMLRLDAAGNNIANAQTPAYRRQAVSQAEDAQGGVSTTVERAVEPGDDLAQDIVEQMSASYSFKANLRVVTTQDEMLGALLDLKA
jgi:flagellar hook protein FlgE